MALAETAKLVVNLSLAGNFASSIGKAGKQLDTFGAKVDKTETRAYRAGQQIGTGIKNGAKIAAVGVGLLASQVALGLRSLVELEQRTTQTEAVIKSTGGVAGITATQVRKLAEEYEGLNATIGDEVIQQGENLLLTFTNIREKAFEPALQAALDMNTALGRGPDGLTGTIKTLGKALNDPKKGLQALSRQGITFSDEQQKRILQLQKEGKLYEAQGLILEELQKRYGGSFLAGGNTTAGKVAKFTDSIEDLQRALATALLPAVGNIADSLTKFLQDPEVIKGVEQLGKDIGNLFSKDNIAEGARLLGGFLQTAKDVAPVLAAAAKTTGAIISAAVKAFQTLPPEIQSLAIGAFAVNKLTGGLVSNIAGGVFGALKSMVVQAGVVNVNGGVVNGGGVGAGSVSGGGGLGKLAAGATIIGAVAIEAESINEFAQKNAQYAAQNLNSAEIAAVRYYQSSATDQAFMAKRLGRIPSKADYDAALSKLGNALKEHEGKNKDDIVQTAKKASSTATAKAQAAKEAVGRVQRSVDRDRADTVARLSAVKGQTASSGHSIVAAIYANRPIITTNVSVSATNVTKVTNVQKNYGNNHPSRNADPNKSYGGGV